jgi:hypothetical protein
MKQSICHQELRRQNSEFENTGGVSQENYSQGFHPAFYDSDSKRSELARFSDGSPAPMHVMDGVPNEWVTERNDAGEVVAIKSSIVAGFMRNGVFYTREQASYLCSQREHQIEDLAEYHPLCVIVPDN